jgi:carbon-monoxide dehydrogenase medium subunit
MLLTRKCGQFQPSVTRSRAGVAIQLTVDAKGICKAAGIGLTNVNPTPLRATRSQDALIGKAVNEDSISQAAQFASEDCKPSADLRGSEEYKRAMVRYW